MTCVLTLQCPRMAQQLDSRVAAAHKLIASLFLLSPYAHGSYMYISPNSTSRCKLLSLTSACRLQRLVWTILNNKQKVVCCHFPFMVVGASTGYHRIWVGQHTYIQIPRDPTHGVNELRVSKCRVTESQLWFSDWVKIRNTLSAHEVLQNTVLVSKCFNNSIFPITGSGLTGWHGWRQ